MTWLQRYHLKRMLGWSLWLMPLLAIGLVLVVAPIIRWLDRETGWSWFNFTPDGALTVLSAFTSSMLTFVAFVVSSLLIVVQLASAQLTPRIIARVLAEWRLKWVLSLFTFAYTYTIAVSGRIAGPTPQLPVAIAIVCNLACLPIFFRFAQVLGTSLRPIAVLQSVAEEDRNALERGAVPPLPSRRNRDRLPTDSGKAAPARGRRLGVLVGTGDWSSWSSPHVRPGRGASADRPALTTTAIGTLLPIPRDAGELSKQFGILTLAAGAMGEFGPLLIVSLLPLEPGQSVAGNALVVALFVIVAVGAALIVVRVRPPRFIALLRHHLHKTSQLPVRLAVLLVAALGAFAMELGLELLAGAFAAGLIVGTVTRGDEAEPFHHKLDGLGFGFLIPIFFVVTGVKFDLGALLGSTSSLLCVPLFLTLFLLARGVPVCLYRRELGGRDRVALAFYSAAALPVVVAITQLGVVTKQMEPGVAAALVGAGMISLLVFPQIALALRSGSKGTPDPGKEHELNTPAPVPRASAEFPHTR